MTPPDLSQLRDIHLPAAVSWWPPAPGWWAVAAVVLLGASGAVFMLRRRKRNRWRRTALHELKMLREEVVAQQMQSALNNLSVLLRRVAISRFPREEVASLHGQPWLDFLDRTFGEGAPFQSAHGKLLSAGPYVREAALHADELDALLSLAEEWVRKLPGGKGK